MKRSLHITALPHQPARALPPAPHVQGSSASSFPSEPSAVGRLTPWARTVDAEGPPTAGRRGLLPAAGRGSRLGPAPGVGRPHPPPRLTLSPPSPEAFAQRWSRTALGGLPWTPHWGGQGSDAPASYSKSSLRPLTPPSSLLPSQVLVLHRHLSLPNSVSAPASREPSL